jgi:hypothetical protein
MEKIKPDVDYIITNSEIDFVNPNYLIVTILLIALLNIYIIFKIYLQILKIIKTIKNG